MSLLGKLFSVAVATVVLATGANATTIGPITFSDDAFVDNIGNTSGTINPTDLSSGTLESTTLQNALTGSDIDSIATCVAGSVCEVELLFVDNVAFNGSGNDLFIFEGGGAETFSLTIAGVTNSFTPGLIPGLTNNSSLPGQAQTNGVGINLDDFGIAPLGEISSLTLVLPVLKSTTFSADIVVVGALNSKSVNAVPLPSSIALFGAAVAAFFGLKRRRNAI